MRLLLDTHAFLWFIAGDQRLSNHARERLPFHHRDPFDRLIIAQAISNELTIISRDSEFAGYPVTTVWKKGAESGN